MTCRRKNFPSKSAAAILSGHTPPAESEQRLLSPCIAATDEVELGQGQEDKESASQFRNPASSHGVLATCLDPTPSINEVAEAMSLPEDFTQRACMPLSLANSLPDRLDKPSAQRELLQVALLHAVPENAHLAQHGSQLSGQELCAHIKATLPVTGICDEGSARGALVDGELASECSGIVSEFEVGHENSFMVPLATVQRVTV